MNKPEQRPSVRETTIKRHASSLIKVAQADPAFRRFMGRALNGLFPATDWKPHRGLRP